MYFIKKIDKLKLIFCFILRCFAFFDGGGGGVEVKSVRFFFMERKKEWLVLGVLFGHFMVDSKEGK